MDWITLIIIACGLAMDSFAVSISCGVVLKRFKWIESAKIATYMGVFQAGMPLFGYLAAVSFRDYIQDWDHWVAFVILFALGVKMIIEGLQPEEERSDFCPLKPKVLFTMAFATSIDALAIGISFALLDIEISVPVVVIGIVTLAFSVFGVWLGSHFSKIKSLKVEIIGGLCLIGIGTKILIEHLFLN